MVALKPPKKAVYFSNRCIYVHIYIYNIKDKTRYRYAPHAQYEGEACGALRFTWGFGSGTETLASRGALLMLGSDGVRCVTPAC